MRIRDRVGSTARDPDFIPKIVALLKDEGPKDDGPITPFDAIETPMPVAKTTRSAAKKKKQKIAPKEKEKKPNPDKMTSKISKVSNFYFFSCSRLKYSNAQSRKMMSIVAKKKIIFERQIKLKEYKEVRIV